MKVDIDDGLRVRKRLGELEMTVEAFGEMMGLSRSAGQRLLQKPHWTTNQLASASEILGWNFLALHAWHVARVLDGTAYLKVSGEGKGSLFLLEITSELSAGEIVRELFDHEI